MAIEILNVRLDREVETGTGSIVDDDGEWLTISTAAHVVARAKHKDIRVRVLPHKHVVWIEAETLGSPIESPPADVVATDDVAFLRVPRALTEFTADSVLNGAAFAPASVMEPGTTCWAYGFDPLNRNMRWVSGRVTDVVGPAINFHAPEVRPGMSGGPLLVALGPVGMTLRRASDGGGALGVSRQRIRALAEAQTVPFTVGSDPVLDALCSAQELKRPLAMSWHKGQRWIAMELEENEGRSFRGTWVTYGATDVSFRGGLGGTLQLDVRGDAIELKLMESKGAEVPLPSEHGLVTMRAVADPFITGHLVLQSADHEALYIAIPTGDCELLAARQILAAATAGRGIPSLEGPGLEVFTTPAKVAGGRYFPFMLTHVASEWTGEPMESVRSFQVAEAHAGATVRLRGEIYPLVPPRKSTSKANAYWTRTRIALRDVVSESDMARLPRAVPPADSVRFDIAFEPSTRDFDFVLRRISGRQGVGGYALRGLVLDYRN